MLASVNLVSFTSVAKASLASNSAKSFAILYSAATE